MPVNEDRGMLFISHTGEVYPCAGLHVSAGNIRVVNSGRNLPQLTGFHVVAGPGQPYRQMRRVCL